MLDIAAKHDAKLSPQNPRRITASALHAWHKAGRKAGASPKKSGPAVARARKALIAAGKAWARMNQLEGVTKKPAEIRRKLLAAVAGTAHAALLKSTPQQSKLMLTLRKPDATSAGLAATTASAVEKRRSDWLTTGNLERWLYGWGQFLLLTGFGIKRLNPATGEMGIYVPKAKRRRIINPDETHLLLSTELEKNGPRASVYSDPELGAPARETVVCSRHTSLFLAVTAAHEVLAPTVLRV